jgi:hypothetical protein
MGFYVDICYCHTSTKASCKQDLFGWMDLISLLSSCSQLLVLFGGGIGKRKSVQKNRRLTTIIIGCSYRLPDKNYVYASFIDEPINKVIFLAYSYPNRKIFKHCQNCLIQNVLYFLKNMAMVNNNINTSNTQFFYRMPRNLILFPKNERRKICW